MRDEEDQSASYQNGSEAEQEQVTIQLVEELGRLIIGFENAETDRRGS